MLQIKQLSTGSSNQQSNTASFAQPIDLLLSCHEKIKHFSSILLKLSVTLKKEGWNDSLSNSAQQIQRYFNIAGPEHHKDEEEHLFPAIIALDPELKNPETSELVQLINRLIKEHLESDRLWKQLDSMLTNKTEDFDFLEDLAQQFKVAMHEHADLENTQIFSYAKKYIGAAEFKVMGSDIAKRRGVSS